MIPTHCKERSDIPCWPSTSPPQPGSKATKVCCSRGSSVVCPPCSTTEEVARFCVKHVLKGVGPLNQNLTTMSRCSIVKKHVFGGVYLETIDGIVHPLLVAVSTLLRPNQSSPGKRFIKG